MGKRFVKFRCGHLRTSEPPSGMPTDTFAQADYDCDMCAGITESMRKHRDGKGFIILYACGHWVNRDVGGAIRNDRTVAPPNLSCEDCQLPHNVRRIPLLGPPAVRERKPKKPKPGKDAGKFVRRKT